MSRRSHKHRYNKNRTKALGDFTVNDFANSAEPKSCRVKKANIKTIIQEVKMVTLKEDERAWDEKDDSDEEDDYLVDNTTHQQQPQRKRKGKQREPTNDQEGFDYPLDLWFLISEYIPPEDVGRFASLCQATLYITTTARFWLTMYRRWYRLLPGLPLDLTPWTMDTERGLRAAVIRSLFFTYAPFIARIAAEKPLNADPTSLLRSQCLLQWHSKEGILHKYFFKFCRPELEGLGSRVGKRWKKDCPVIYNPEANCYILEATCPTLCNTVMVMGESLYHAGLGVSANLLHHRLRLSLTPAHLLPALSSAPTRKYQVPATEISLDPVLDVRLYPWWHPRYMDLGTGAGLPG